MLFGVSSVTWRLLLMMLVAVLVTASMNVFEVERKRKIKQLEEARREAQRIALTIHTKTRQETEVWLDALVKIGRRIAGMEEADDSHERCGDRGARDAGGGHRGDRAVRG